MVEDGTLFRFVHSEEAIILYWIRDDPVRRLFLLFLLIILLSLLRVFLLFLRLFFLLFTLLFFSFFFSFIFSFFFFTLLFFLLFKLVNLRLRRFNQIVTFSGISTLL